MCIIVSVFTFTGKIHIGIRCLRRNLFSTFMHASVNFLVEKKTGGPLHAMGLFMYSDLATLPLISVTFLKEIIEYIILTNTFEVNQSVGTYNLNSE